MKGEKNKLILIYVLMFLVIILIVALTFVILNSTKKDTNKEVQANNTPTVEINPYPEVSKECTFDITLAQYNSLTGPNCKGGYTRYNITNISVDGKNLNTVIIYSDQNGNKAGLYLNNKKVLSKVNNPANIKMGLFDTKLFILDNNNNESNVLAYSSDATKLYDLKEILAEAKITDPAFQNLANQTISSKTIDPNGFTFNADNFTFKTQTVDATNQIVTGSTYKVSFTNENFTKPTFVSIN